MAGKRASVFCIVPCFEEMPRRRGVFMTEQPASIGDLIEMALIAEVMGLLGERGDRVGSLFNARGTLAVLK